MTADGLRFLAHYLPQFHPIPENDEWWGKGFTEWTNVAKARPLYRGHYQPHVPADLGHYDLRVPEVRAAQAELAKQYGIDGFLYYHYWFHGRRLLERPFAEVLASGEPDFPFALCWANENWTRIWDGGTKHKLMVQYHCPDDDLAHIRALAPAFADKRYVRIDGRPVFGVYRASELPDPKRTCDIWREECVRLGVGEPYLVRIEAFGDDDREDPAWQGFDAGVEFNPDAFRLGRRRHATLPHRLARKAFHRKSAYRMNYVYSYERVVDLALAAQQPAWKRFRGVTPGWDNSARRRFHARILHGSTPALYEKWVRGVVRQFTPYSPEENLVFVNAWNEWAEGNHLEPDLQWGRAYLEANLAGRAA